MVDLAEVVVANRTSMKNSRFGVVKNESLNIDKAHSFITISVALGRKLNNSMSIISHSSFSRFVLLLALLFISQYGIAQVNANGCVAGGVGINATLYANGTLTTGTVLPPAGPVDWFKNATGRNIIDQTNSAALQTLLQNNSNPTYIRRQNGELASHVDEEFVGGVR